MIAGIVAAQPLSFPDFVASDALVALDFVAGTYSVSGVSVTAADVVDHPEWITASGLELRFAHETTQGTGVAHIIGDALTALLAADWTVVVEFETVVEPSFTFLFSVTSDGPTWSDAIWAALDTDSEIGFFEQASGSTVRNIDDAAVISGSSVHRFALTRTASRMAVSIGGAAVLTDEADSSSLSPTVATFGAFDGDWLGEESNIRSLTLYPPQADVDLPTLSS